MINQVSDRKLLESKRYSFLRSVRYSPGEGCQAQLDMCMNLATDVQHRQGKGVARSRILDVDNWLPVCRMCHDWIEEHPLKAAEMDKGLTQAIGDPDPAGVHVTKSRCRGCFGFIAFFHTTTGESVPVDASRDGVPIVDPAGTVLFQFEQPGFFDTDPVRRIVETQVEPIEGHPMWVEHRLTCPMAERIGAA